MGLKFKTVTAAQLAKAFQDASDEGKTAGMDTLAAETKIIAEISEQMAPVDTGELEKAHKVVRRANGSNKVTFDVVVGGIVDGVDVDKYATLLHEGVYNLVGPKSKLKNGSSKYTVGRKFLERAYEARIDQTLTNIMNAVASKVKKMLANEIANKIRELGLDNMPTDDDGNPIVRVGFLESTYQRGVLVMTPLDGMMTSPEIPGWIKGTVQIITRDPDAQAAHDLAVEIAKELTVKGAPLELESYKLACFYPYSEPILFPVNEAGLFEVSVNFDCKAVSPLAL